MPAKQFPADKICVGCQCVFGRNSTKSIADYKEKKFCTRECWEKYRVGPNHPNWRGGIKHRPDGYIRDSKTDKYLHRIVMEKHLGRELRPEENIHHIDGNNQNNDINNLKIMSNSEHRKLEYKLAPKDKNGRFIKKN